MTAAVFEVVQGRKVYRDRRLAASARRTSILKKPSAEVDVTVIIPSMDRLEIAHCLANLHNSLLQAGLRAHLVIVDQSIDPAKACHAMAQAKAATRQHTVFSAVLFHRDISLTISTAKNTAFRLIKSLAGTAGLGRLIVFLDTDIYVTPSSLKLLHDGAVQQADIDAFSLPSLWLREDAQLKWLSTAPSFDELEPAAICKPEPELLAAGRYDKQARLVRVPAIHGCIFAIRPAAFQAIGGFNHFFGMHGEHVELCRRLRRQGHTMAYLLDGVVLHDDRAVEQSVMRNLPDREQYLLATLIAIHADRSTSTDNALFASLMHNKWLPNLGIAQPDASQVQGLLGQLGDLLRHHCHDNPRFQIVAHQAIDACGLPKDVKSYMAQAVRYITANSQLIPGTCHQLD